MISSFYLCGFYVVLCIFAMLLLQNHLIHLLIISKILFMTRTFVEFLIKYEFAAQHSSSQACSILTPVNFIYRFLVKSSTAASLDTSWVAFHQQIMKVWREIIKESVCCYIQNCWPNCSLNFIEVTHGRKSKHHKWMRNSWSAPQSCTYLPQKLVSEICLLWLLRFNKA